MWNKKLIATTLAVLALIIGTGYVLATEPGRIKAGQQSLHNKAAETAQGVTGAIKPTAVLTVDEKCPTGNQTKTREVPVDQVTSQTMIGMVDQGCMIHSNNAALSTEVPNVQGAEAPIKGDGFRDGQGKITLTATGTTVTVKVDATAKAGVTSKEITATAQSEFTGDGVEQKLAQDFKDATVQAAPVIAEKAAPQTPVNKVVVDEKPAPATNKPTQTTSTVAPPAAEDIVNSGYIQNHFKTGPVDHSTSAQAGANASQNRKKGP